MRFFDDMRLLVLIAILATAAAVPAAEITPQNVIAEINVHRASAGLPPLQEDSRLLRAANLRMRDMEEQSYWAHVAPDGRSPFDVVATGSRTKP